MAYNVSGWGAAAPNAKYWVSNVLNGGAGKGGMLGRAVKVRSCRRAARQRHRRREYHAYAHNRRLR